MLSGNPKELDYELSGDIQIDLPLVGAIPFNQAGTIPLTRGSNAESLQKGWERLGSSLPITHFQRGNA